MQIQMAAPLASHQAANDQCRRDILRNHRCQSDTCYTQMTNNNKKQIKANINNPCRHQIEQRSFRISHCTKDRTAEIIQQCRRHGQEINLQIQTGLIQNIIRWPHPDQKCSCHSHAKNQQKNTTDHAKSNSCMYRFIHFIISSGTMKTGHKNIGTHRKSDKKINQQVDQWTGGSHCSQCRTADKSANHNNICCIKQQL